MLLRSAVASFTPALFLAALLLAGTGCSRPYRPSDWLTHVPQTFRCQADPLPVTAAGISEGRRNYGFYCDSCHGPEGAGRRGRPTLSNARVRDESDGEIFWILENGSKNHGMPAWRSLGSPALWQLVQYIRTLPPVQ